MNQFGIHYAYWGNEWKVDMCERIRLAADAALTTWRSLRPIL